MLTEGIQQFHKNLIEFIKNDQNVPKTIRDDLEGASEIALQTGAGFFILKYYNAQDIPMSYHYTAMRDGGMLMMTTSGM